MEPNEELTNEIYECPSCGANLKFLPDKEALFCEYCNTTISLKGEASNEELDFLANCDNPVNDWDVESKIVHCENCGSNNVVSKKEITSNCPFCGSSSVINSNELVGEKPNRVIPFKLGKEQVITNYQKWLKKKFFVPSKIKKNIPNPLINGVYIPSWTYDSNTVSTYNGRLGKRYTTTVGSGKNRRTVTRIRYFRVSGVHKKYLDDLLVCSGEKLEQSALDKLAPYNTNDSYLYDERYLAGFSAEHYNLSLKNGWEVAKRKGKEIIKYEILSKYHYDVIDYLNINTIYDKIQYKYVILPVWICIYKYDNKEYKFMVNGETGKVVGKTPISALKVTLVVLLAIILLILLICWMNY
ncbi:MAG: hypothetical protein IJX78_03455 [Bacilli bacterium]|nr:hypothetical protein [Bacilli bacterium]